MIETVLHYLIYKTDRGILGEKNAESKGDRETISFKFSFKNWCISVTMYNFEIPWVPIYLLTCDVHKIRRNVLMFIDA